MTLSSACHLVLKPAESSSLMGNAYISIPLGITIGLLASFVQSLGLTIQRKSHVLNQRLPEHKQRVEHRRPLWLLGFGVFISSNILGSFVQIASLPVVILAPLGAVSLLWNAFFARLLLGDVFSPWMILGTLLIAGGAVLIAVFGIVPEPTRSLEDLLELFRRPAFVAYFSTLGVLVFLCLAITHFAEYSLSQRVEKATSTPPRPSPSPSPSSVTLHTLAGRQAEEYSDDSADIAATERTPLIDPKSKSQLKTPPKQRSIEHTRLLIAVSYASFSGILSGMCLLFAKSGVELLLLTIRGQNQFWRWEAWTLLLGLVVFALLQLWYLHKALIQADPTLVCPSAFCFYNLSSIVNGLVYFDQFSLIPLPYLLLVSLGIVILLGGVWVVSIHSGGGGVDVGTWSAESDAESVDEPATAPLAGNAPPASVVLTSGQRVGPVPMERETRSEGCVGTLSSSPEAILLGNEGNSRIYTSPESLTNESLSPSPSRPRLPYQQRRPTIDMRSPQLRAASHTNTYSSHGSTLPPTSPPQLLSTGFQIGLSPMSPGFSLLPRERKRRTAAGLSTLLGEESSGDTSIGLLFSGGGGRRRTMSEGDVGHRSSLIRHSEVDTMRVVDERQEGGSQADEDSQSGSRWKWLRRIFR
ncbi:hypothetical protein BDN72DRAFT_27260 [Pluteus cervinus]|uniref:Uncharacterized protein n=1 Tax=Pluteus cervinus TaxID=181527 RepID=A0ACD3BGD8_9AGAR|nr:hypothetical protein BDN72DRAFT_27260 [Pluteus cervinus]